jgi:hypothetical protein
MGNPHIGSVFDESFKEEGIHVKIKAVAIKPVIACKLGRLMKSKQVAKTQMTSSMCASRAVVNRLLD